MWCRENSVSCSVKDSVTVHLKEDDCLIVHLTCHSDIHQHNYVSCFKRRRHLLEQIKGYFCEKKKIIFERFFYFLRPAFGHGCLGHPQSLKYFFYVFCIGPTSGKLPRLKICCPQYFPVETLFIKLKLELYNHVIESD